MQQKSRATNRAHYVASLVPSRLGVENALAIQLNERYCFRSQLAVDAPKQEGYFDRFLRYDEHGSGTYSVFWRGPKVVGTETTKVICRTWKYVAMRQCDWTTARSI